MGKSKAKKINITAARLFAFVKLWRKNVSLKKNKEFCRDIWEKYPQKTIRIALCNPPCKSLKKFNRRIKHLIK